MEYVLLVIGIILIILMALLVILNLKNKNSSVSFGLYDDIKKANDEQERRILDDNNRLRLDINQIQVNTNKDIQEFKDNLSKSIEERFNNVGKILNEGILNISKEMNKNVSDNFEKTNQTFESIKERIAAISEAQKSLQNVENSIDSFKDVLENKKMRGNFGEFQLESLLIDAFGYREGIYVSQAKMSNGFIADILLTLPEPLGKIVIDSKFPFDNYKKIYDSQYTEIEKEEYRKLFKEDCKKHVNDISKKYIIKNETTDQAMMFIPSEAVFAEIMGNNTDVVDYARKNKIWITSPTTLMAILETIELVLRDKERSKDARKILEELKKLSEEFERYESRWQDFEKHLNMVVNDADKINKTNTKITNKFKVINKASLPGEIETEELDLISTSSEEEEDL